MAVTKDEQIGITLSWWRKVQAGRTLAPEWPERLGERRGGAAKREVNTRRAALSRLSRNDQAAMG
jgi:hypothetical protein